MFNNHQNQIISTCGSLIVKETWDLPDKPWLLSDANQTSPHVDQISTDLWINQDGIEVMERNLYTKLGFPSRIINPQR